MLDTLFAGILDMSLTASLVIVMVLLARLALGKMPKIFSYCLWAVVLLRLLCPIGIALPVSTGPTLPSISEHYSLADVEIPLPEIGSAAINGLIHATNFNPDTYAVQIPLAPSPARPSSHSITCAPWETWVLLGQYWWAAGALILVCCSIFRYLHLRKRISEAVCLQDRVFEVDQVANPFVAGLFCPKIYLPSGLSEQMQKYILAHEQHHIRRLDPLWKLLGFAAVCLHWFNPLVWLAFALATQDMEMSCDEAVAKKLSPNARADYAQVLLRFSSPDQFQTVPAFGESNPAKRIANLTRWKQPRRIVSLLTALCCVLLMFGCAVDGKETTQPAPLQGSVLPAGKATLLYDIYNDKRNPEEDVYFQLEEFPGVQFLLSGATVHASIDQQWHRILSGLQIYLDDLNGDGKREFLANETVGSGIIDYRVNVYDFADDMHYCMQRRMQMDFEVSFLDGQLMILQYPYTKMYADQYESAGKMVIDNRQIYYVTDTLRLQGTVESTSFYTQWLPMVMAQAQESISLGMWFDIDKNPVTDAYMQQHIDSISPAIVEEEERRFFIDSALMEDKDTMLYLDLLNKLSSPYSYYHMHNRYVYQDPEKPDQLLICTELRDTGFSSIRAYYEALCAGKCQPHPETYIVRLDQKSICCWGSEQNLYAEFAIS